jgi:hypothetical protein
MGISRREALEIADLRTGESNSSLVEVVVTDIKTPRRAISGVTQWVNQLRGERLDPVMPDPAGESV